MDDNEDIKDRILTLIESQKLSTRAFERLCGLSNGYVNNIRKSIQPDKLEAIAAQFSTLNKGWLMTGEGPMLKEEGQADHFRGATEKVRDGLPLIPVDAVAGFNGVDSPGVLLDDCRRYSIPEFATAGAEYLIRVSGSSMYPKYSSGDILACRRVREVTFIQYGKIYVIDSQQGAMVKRLFPDPDNADALLCRSDNDKYPDFELPKSEIRSLSIVVGAIRME